MQDRLLITRKVAAIICAGGARITRFAAAAFVKKPTSQSRRPQRRITAFK